MSDDIDISSIKVSIFNESLCKIIKTVRQERDITQDQVARVIGVTSQQYQKYETGVNRFSILYLVKVCNYLDIDIKEIIDTCVDKATENKKNKSIRRNVIINNYNNYNYYYNGLVNMNINKRLFINTIMLGIIAFWIISFLKFTPLNNNHNIQLLSTQITIFAIIITILYCSAFPVSILTWVIIFTVMICVTFSVYSIFIHTIAGSPKIHNIRAILYLLSLLFTWFIVLCLKRKERKEQETS